MKRLDRFYLGLDIGGTNVRIACYDVTKKIILGLTRVPFQKFGTALAEVETNVIGLINQAVKSHDFNLSGLQGVGISLAALFDRKTGTITSWPNNRLWDQFPFREYLTQSLKVPVVMEDDANSAGFGEYLAGAGKGFEHFAYITVSTGIGCGLVLDGRLFTGVNGWAGEIGHIPIMAEGPPCKCGKRGCLQSLASGPALLERGWELARQEGISPERLTDLRDLVCLAQEGTGWALQVFEEAGNYLAGMIIYLVMTLDLPLIVLGGGVSQAGPLIFDPIRKTVDSFFSGSGRKVQVKTCQLGDDNGVIGALNLLYGFLNNGSNLLLAEPEK